MNPPQNTPQLPLLNGRVISGPASARLTIDDRDYINFFGSGYLALSRLPQIRAAALRALDQGAAFSSQVPAAYGALTREIRDLEEIAAASCGSETSVYFASGYFSGAVALGAIDTDASTLFIDQSAHFSLFDAAQLTGRPIVRFAHCDPEDLRAAVKRELAPQARPIVLSDGIFATTGRLAPLDAYAAIIETYAGQLVVDESHGFGVIGPNGRGAADFLGVQATTTTAATLSKALCAHGGIIGCRRTTAEKLQAKPPLRGANAGSPISAAVANAALRFMLNHPERRLRLAGLTNYLRAQLKDIGISVAESPAPIVAFRIGDRRFMQEVQKNLFDRGIHILFSDYIGAGVEGLIRLAVFADHTEADLDELVAGLAECTN